MILLLLLWVYPGVSDTCHRYTFAHTWVLAHMMLSIVEMCQNDIQFHAPPDDHEFFVSILLILVFCMA